MTSTSRHWESPEYGWEDMKARPRFGSCWSQTFFSVKCETICVRVYDGQGVMCIQNWERTGGGTRTSVHEVSGSIPVDH